MRDNGYYNNTMDFWVQKAIRDIQKNYGHQVSIAEKGKDLIKFGRSDQVQTTYTTLMELPAGVYNETYVTDNLITTVSSSSPADTYELAVEGHTIDGNGDFTFVEQTVTLTGQTQASLATPLARCTRMYNTNGTAFVGNIYAYEDDTSTLGVPDTSTGVHCMISAGRQQSAKCATTISKDDYWLLTNMGVSMYEKAAAFADCSFEMRLKGGVFRDVFLLAVSSGITVDHNYPPVFIVPPNSDVRLVARANANGKQVAGHLQGTLLKIV